MVQQMYSKIHLPLKQISVSLVRSLSNFLRTKMKLNESTLVLTQVMFRHGHRTPDQTLSYPGDPYENETYLPYGKGELTMIGRKQCFALGKSLRNRYTHLLGPDYIDGIISAKSSELSRARTTLQLVLAGLFPPTTSRKIQDDLNWQPIPFTYKSIIEDKLIGKAIVTLRAEHESHPDFGKTANSQEVIKCIEKELKWKITKQAYCLVLFDTLKTQIDYGLEMPKWCTEIYPEKLQIEFESFATHNFSRKDFLITAQGHFIKEINDVMINKMNEISQNQEKIPKIYLYSGHDVNIGCVLSMFQQLDASKWPNYTSNIAFELHNVNGEFLVRILHQNGPSDARNFENEEEISIIKLPNGNDAVCKISEFTEYVKDYFPSESEGHKL